MRSVRIECDVALEQGVRRDTITAEAEADCGADPVVVSRHGLRLNGTTETDEWGGSSRDPAARSKP